MANDKELKEQLAEITTELYHVGFVTSSGGNLSARSVEREGALWITPSRLYKGALKPEQMVLINLDGELLEGDYPPSVEHIYHSGVMRLRSNVNAVIHTHAPLATVFGMTDLEMPPITVEAIFVRKLPKVPFHLGGTKELAQAVMEYIGQTHVSGAYLRNHGLVTVGPDLRKAADMTLMIEHTVGILLQLHQARLEPSLIGAETIERLNKYIEARAAV